MTILLVLLGIVVGFVAICAVVVMMVDRMNHKNFYTKGTCVICGNPTGFEGNRRFMLADGCMCEACALRVCGGDVPTLNQFASRGFASDTESYIRARIALREEEREEKEARLRAANAPLINGVNYEEMLLNLKYLHKASLKATDEELNRSVKCPKCGCTSLSANKRGFDVGNAVLGASVFGSMGLSAGQIGADKVYVTCLKCGYQWKAGK